MRIGNIKLHNSSYNILCFIGFITPFIALFSGLSLAAFFVIGAILPTVICIKDGQLKNICTINIYKIIIIFLFYALMSAFWAIDPAQSFKLWYRMVLFTIGAYSLFYYAKTLSDKQRQKLGEFVACGVAIAIIAANIEIYNDGLLTKFFMAAIRKPHLYELVDLNRGAAYLSVMMWPAFAFFLLRAKKIAAITFLAIGVFTLFNLESQSSVLALIIGIFTFLFVIVGGKRALSLIMVLAILAVPAVAVTAYKMNPEKVFNILPNSGNSASEYRLHIWHYAAIKSMDKPVFGWGFNAARSFPVKESEYVLNGRHPLPLHTHNNVMQLWLELGIIGLLIFVAFLSLSMQAVKGFAASGNHCHDFKNEPSSCGLATGASGMDTLIKSKYDVCKKSVKANLPMALMTGVIASYFALGQTGFGMWQNWWVAGGIFAWFFCYLLLHRK